MKKTVYSDTKHQKYVFLDRDGVINVERGDFTTSISEWEWAPGSLAGIRLLTDAGFGIIVITNQSCISRGLQTAKGLATLHDYMHRIIRESGGEITAVYHCPHQKADKCTCRKPSPEMILRAIDDYRIHPAETFFIGDAGRDMEAGRRAGVRTIYITGTLADSGVNTSEETDFIASNLVEAAHIVLRESKKIAGCA